MAKKNFYSYMLADGDCGIVETWAECKKITHGKSSEYKGHTTREEAQEWIDDKIGTGAEVESEDTGYNF